MTTDRIRWCMWCNLIASSRRCPICGKDAMNLHIDDGSSVSPIFQQQADSIRGKIDAHYGEGCGKLFLPDDSTSLFIRSRGGRQIVVNGGIVGKMNEAGKILLNASGLNMFPHLITKNYIACDHDASYFVSKGRSVMVTGITEMCTDIPKGGTVAILDDSGTPIAEGVMKMSFDEFSSSDRGVAVSVRDNTFSRVSYSANHTWAQTIEANMPSLKALAGEAARKIGYLSSSYGYPFVIQLSSDIVSEANLLLVLEAGFKPSVMIESKDDFIDYLAEKHGLSLISELPEKCILITEKKGISSTDIIPHSPTEDWDQTMVWMYVMMKAEPFNPNYMQRLE